MKKWTLQVRLMVIVGVILLAACLLLTANSLFAARTYYGDYAALIESGNVAVDPALEEELEIDPALAEPGAFYRIANEKFSTQSILALALIIALALGCTYLATRQVLRPLKTLIRSVGSVDERHMDQRVPLAGAQGEVLDLAAAFNRMLEQLEESFLIQKSFAANAAHELKTPLAAIKSSLQVLEMDPCPEQADYREFMTDTGESLERIIKTVEGLLALANLENLPVGEVVELRILLEQAVRELSGQAKDRDVAFKISGDSVTVRGNPSLLYRAFYNLIENAIKYNRRGGTVSVSLESDEDLVHIRVEDTGMGITADALPHIFEPFYRADPSRSQQIAGSGLGLAVVRMILERHGGKITAVSKAERGSIFTVELTRQPRIGDSGAKSLVNGPALWNKGMQ